MDESPIGNFDVKKELIKTINFLKQKKIINLIIIILFLFLLIGSSWIRLQNLPLLKDSTTGEYLPLALDPFYFLRIAETMVEQGGLPEHDLMRYPSAQVGFTHEILPQAVVFIWKIWKIFDTDATLQFVDVISPVIFFALGLILFFFLIFILTKSKITALVSSIFLAIIPTYLYRTMAGFSDHEAIGMLAFLLTLLAYTFALKFLDKEPDKEKNHLLKTVLLGLLGGFLAALTIVSWGGIAKFLFMIIPFSFGLFWLVKTQDLENVNKKQLKRYILFYISWIVFSILSGLLYGITMQSMISTSLLASSSLINGFILLFILADFSIINLKNKINFIKKENLEKYRVLYSFLAVLIIGIVFLAIYKQGIFSYISEIFEKLLHPFGTSRTGLTVAENAQPFLDDWRAQTGKIFFWLFFGGLITIGVKFAEKIKQNKNKFLFGFFWILMIFGILFSRISSSSLLNGTNFISKLFYFGSLVLFFIILSLIYFNDKIRLKPEQTVLFAWAFFMLISVRGAVRFFFLITPFVCFSAGYFIVNIVEYVKKSKDDLLKMFLVLILILTLVGALFSFYNLTSSTLVQAKYTGPSANYQWQQAMSWVRENIPEDSIFVHWWDYGYWVQYLGKRPTVTDGGHAVGFWDHLIGRYVLTTPEPETALSFMKSHDVSYLLIDPTDIGKYPAYSIIGSDEEGNDRTSMIPSMQSDPSQIKETSSGMVIVYNGGFAIDEDIVYELEGQQVFFPANKAAIIGVILETINSTLLKQPEVVFFYNNKQTKIPLRYVYYNEQLKDFGTGLEAVIKIIPRIYQSNQGFQVDNLGAIMYLSPKVSRSLVAQVYLLNDAFNNYETLELVHAEPSQNIAYLNSQGANLEDFVYFNGIEGPIKIWKVNYPENIITREEFLRTSGGYAEFDNLDLTR